ncbi:unnamed protein product, partial [Thlaspi arvense]
MVTFKEEKWNGLGVGNLLVSANGTVHASPPYLPIRAFGRFDGYKISNPCDGLICLYTFTRIINLVNPATTSRRRLPDPRPDGGVSHPILIGIGRENSACPRYKLVWFFESYDKGMCNTTRCMVFALDSNTWRNVDPPHDCRVHYDHPLIHLEGVMYCFAHSRWDLKLLAFDLHTETSQSFSITPDIGVSYFDKLIMRLLNHRLCIFKSFVDKDDLVLKIWGLDMNKRSWEVMYSIDLSCLPPEFKESRISPIETIHNYVIISN